MTERPRPWDSPLTRMAQATATNTLLTRISGAYSQTLRDKRLARNVSKAGLSQRLKEASVVAAVRRVEDFEAGLRKDARGLQEEAESVERMSLDVKAWAEEQQRRNRATETDYLQRLKALGQSVTDPTQATAWNTLNAEYQQWKQQSEKDLQRGFRQRQRIVRQADRQHQAGVRDWEQSRERAVQLGGKARVAVYQRDKAIDRVEAAKRDYATGSSSDWSNV